MDMPILLRVDIVSDIVCPWCIIGYKQLEKAIGMVEQPIAMETHWHPFELNRDMAPEGEDIRAHINRKYGATPEQSAANRGQLSKLGDSLGFSFEFGDNMRIYNTFAAHKLLMMAGREAGWTAQTALKMALFQAYFQQGKNVGDTDILIAIAEQQGMDRASALACLESEEVAHAVRAEQAHWIDENVTAVPAFIFDQKYMIPGAQEAETFARMIGKILAKRDAV